MSSIYHKPVEIEEIGEKQVTAEMRGIVGFRILVEEIQAAYKLCRTGMSGVIRRWSGNWGREMR